MLAHMVVEISNYLISVKAIDVDENEKVYNKEDINFSYRYSSFPKSEILIEAKFQFKKGDLKEINENQMNASKKRKINQPLRFRSAGSIFKNPNEGPAAGYLIDQCNLKGLRIN